MTETARMYGGSLYDLAAEEGLEARILGELDEAVALFKANPDYLHLLSTPSIPKKERCGLLDEALRGQVHLYVLNFLKILCEKGTLRELSGCARAYRIRYNQAHGILEATAISAVPLTEQQRAALKGLHDFAGFLPADNRALLPVARLTRQLDLDSAHSATWINDAARQARLARIESQYATQVQMLSAD